MTNLSNYIDFAHSLQDMDEVKKGKFRLPKEIVFEMPKIEHSALQTQAHDAKGLKKNEFEHNEEFTVNILGIDFKFVESK
jgi:hypothetical protein